MAATSPSPRTVSLTLVINPKSNRLLFATSGKDFVDFLFYIMSLPVGTVIRLLGEQGTVGCIGNIYRSIKNLDDSYMLSAARKDMLLKPMQTSYLGNAAFLLPTMESSKHTNLFKCHNQSCLNVAVVPGFLCPSNGHHNWMRNSMNLTFVNPTINDPNSGDDGGFVKEVPYMVMDDLTVIPMSVQAILTLFNEFNVSGDGCPEEKVVAVGVNECVELLRASMQTKAVLSSVFLGNKEASIKSEPIP